MVLMLAIEWAVTGGMRVPATDTPVPIRIKGLRIGINGKEALAGQAFANVGETISNGSYGIPRD